MEKTVGISFSNNHCYITQFTRENEILSLTSVVSFFDEVDSLSAIRANITAIKSLISKSTRVILALPSHETLLKNVTVDAVLTDEEIITHIQSQSLILFGYPKEQLCFDYETHLIEQGNRHLVVAACHQSKISTYQDCFKELKLPLDAIDIDIFSLLRLTPFLTNAKDFILLFQHNNHLLVIVTRNGKPQKSDAVHFTSPEALAQLNSYCSANEKIIAIISDHKLITHLNQLGFSYDELTTSSLFNSAIQNNSTLPNHALHPFFISMGAGLWSAA